MRFFRRSLVALGVAAILPTILFAAVLVFYLLRAEGERVESEALARSQNLITLVDARLNGDIAALRILTTSSYLDTRDWIAYYPRMRHVWQANPQWITVSLYDARSGEEIFDVSKPLRSPRVTTLRGELGLSALEHAHDVVIGGVEADPESKQYRIILHMPVRRDGQLAYVYTIELRPQLFQEILLKNTHKGTVVGIVDRHGRFIARNLNYEQRLGQPATQFVRAAIREGQQGIYRGKTFEGLENYTAFSTSPLSGWSAHIVIPSALIDTPTSWSFLVAAIAALGAILLGTVLVVLVLRDMAERRRAEETLRQSQKMEAVGQLTGGIAHDFNNLLTAVIGNLDMIRNRSAGNDKLQRLADNALEAARRGAKLTAQLLAFSRNQRMSIAPVDLSKLLSGMSGLLAQSVGPTIDVIVRIHPEANMVLSDANQLELALLNLAVNARDAMPNGGAFSISSAVASAADTRQLSNRLYVEIKVTDTGVGMSEAVRARALEPFFTTKPVGHGTGLGLSQVYGVVRESGGTLFIESAENDGTTIRLILPAAPIARSAYADTIRQPRTVPSAHAAQEKLIVVVDDDAQVRRFVVESLVSLGYKVIETAGGHEALAELQRVRADLLVVDFAMPGMNGAEVARIARDRWPTLPVMMISGYADSAAVEAAVGAVHMLRKPFDLAELGAAVADVLKNQTH